MAKENIIGRKDGKVYDDFSVHRRAHLVQRGKCYG